MSKPHDDFKKLDFCAGENAVPCPVCGADAEIWQFSYANDGPSNKVVMCANGEVIGPQDGITDEGCLLYMPPQGFYRATKREAIKYWNEFSKAISAQRRGRGWARAKVMREGNVE